MTSEFRRHALSANASPVQAANPMSHPEVFPILNAEELEQCHEFGTLCNFASGDKLVEVRQRTFDCFVILSGSVCVMDTSAGEKSCIAKYGAGAFSGDIDLFTGRPAVVDLEADSDIEAIRLSTQKIREMMVRKPVLGAKLWRCFQRRREAMLQTIFQGLHVYGAKDDRRTLEAIEFLYRNGVPMRWQNIAETKHLELCRKIVKSDSPRYPVITYGDVLLLEEPRLRDLANMIGLNPDFSQKIYDVIILGAGPSGLGAAVYAASEGLSTLVLDGLGPGGQAGSSSRIENYAGFPNGISGRELAQLSYLQALKFGAHFASPCHVDQLSRNAKGCYELTTTEGERACGKTILIATGVDYRLLDVKGLEQLTGTGVFYNATTIEATLCENSPVHVVGAGNSAGQAAMFLSQYACEVVLVVRGDNLEKSMSSYLSERVKANPRIKILFQTEVVAIEGKEHISAVHLKTASDQPIREQTVALFVFIGSRPKTDFLPPELLRDERGYAVTGVNLTQAGNWHEDRLPEILETSMPGIFASGDCRMGTTKRVAAAIGDGALAVTCISNYLAQKVFG